MSFQEGCFIQIMIYLQNLLPLYFVAFCFCIFQLLLKFLQIPLCKINIQKLKLKSLSFTGDMLALFTLLDNTKPHEIKCLQIRWKPRYLKCHSTQTKGPDCRYLIGIDSDCRYNSDFYYIIQSIRSDHGCTLLMRL